ncbi:hypothetical protein TRAPUB_8765 [Trametes pubescens]|uniref:Uncharacterized protein n=1 Tax=Trametes pubescens TaxID=154538 RepID=A0A1M2W4M4_TRAPU|nr:hypothetical protein TRAPUB_8765 [Trametes pubescens]
MLSAVPSHVMQMSRTSSTPAKPRTHQRSRRQDRDVPQRPSSAGHTPGVALRPLPPLFTDPWVEDAAQDSHSRDDTHRPHHKSRRDASDAALPQSRPQAMPTIVAPSPTRPQAAPILTALLPSTPTVAAPSPTDIRPLSMQTVGGGRLKGFGTPSPSTPSQSSVNGEEPHGGFYDAQGYPVKGVQLTADGQVIESPFSAGWKTASSATLVPTPRAARKQEMRTPRYQCGDYALYSPEPSATPRPKAVSRRAPRPRSNSFGGY